MSKFIAIINGYQDDIYYITEDMQKIKNWMNLQSSAYEIFEIKKVGKITVNIDWKTVS